MSSDILNFNNKALKFILLNFFILFLYNTSDLKISK